MTQRQSTPETIINWIAVVAKGRPDVEAFLEIARLARIGEHLASRNTFNPVVDMENIRYGLCRNGWKATYSAMQVTGNGERVVYLMTARSPDAKRFPFKVFPNGVETLGVRNFDIIGEWSYDAAERERLVRLAGGQTPV